MLNQFLIRLSVLILTRKRVSIEDVISITSEVLSRSLLMKGFINDVDSGSFKIINDPRGATNLESLLQTNKDVTSHAK